MPGVTAVEPGVDVPLRAERDRAVSVPGVDGVCHQRDRLKIKLPFVLHSCFQVLNSRTEPDEPWVSKENTTVWLCWEILIGKETEELSVW